MTEQTIQPDVDASYVERLIDLAKAVTSAEINAEFNRGSWNHDRLREAREQLTEAMRLDVAEAIIRAPREPALWDLLDDRLCGIGWDPILRAAERVTGTASRIMVDRLMQNWKDQSDEYSLSEIIDENPGRYAPYAAEMLAFEDAELARLTAVREAEEAAEVQRIAARAAELGCTVALLQYIESLERRIAA